MRRAPTHFFVCLLIVWPAIGCSPEDGDSGTQVSVDAGGSDATETTPSDAADVCCAIPGGGEKVLTHAECADHGGKATGGPDACGEDPPPPPPPPTDICCLLTDDIGQSKGEYLSKAACLEADGTPAGTKYCEDVPPPPPPPEAICCALVGPDGEAEYEYQTPDDCKKQAGKKVPMAHCKGTPPPPDELVCCGFYAPGSGVEWSEVLPLDECMAQGGEPIGGPKQCKDGPPPPDDLVCCVLADSNGQVKFVLVEEEVCKQEAGEVAPIVRCKAQHGCQGEEQAHPR